MSALLSKPIRRATTADEAPTAAPTLGLTELIEMWRPALDALGTNVFIADLDLTLIFANKKAQDTLRGIDGDLRSSFGISAAEVVGGSIHRFHKDPNRVERVLHRQGFTLPHQATFGFGKISLQTTIDAVNDTEGNHVAYAVAWEDVSALRESNRAVQELGSHLETAATAVEELSASIGEIARSATQATGVTTKGVGEADTTTTAVRELGEASSAIGEVVRTITAIAQQTNILALNATIEAARAGEAGRGFAVVAGEVKDLARDTAAATEDIGRRIDAVRRSSDEVVTSIEGIATLLREIDEIQNGVAATVEEQRVATDQLAESVNEAASSSRHLIEAQTH